MIFSKIYKYIIIALSVVVLGLGTVAYLEYQNILSKQATIASQTKDIDALNKKVIAYEKGIEIAQKTQREQEKIYRSFKDLRDQIASMKDSKCLEKSDEKIFTDITVRFNDAWVQPAGSSDATKEILSKAVKSDSYSSSVCWSTKQIADNYESLVEYTIQLEKTVECFSED